MMWCFLFANKKMERLGFVASAAVSALSYFHCHRVIKQRKSNFFVEFLGSNIF